MKTERGNAVVQRFCKNVVAQVLTQSPPVSAGGAWTVTLGHLDRVEE